MSVSVQMPFKRLQETTSIDQFFVNLDIIEEYLEAPEHLPFEGIEEKQEALKVSVPVLVIKSSLIQI